MPSHRTPWCLWLPAATWGHRPRLARLAEVSEHPRGECGRPRLPGWRHWGHSRADLRLQRLLTVELDYWPPAKEGRAVVALYTSLTPSRRRGRRRARYRWLPRVGVRPALTHCGMNCAQATSTRSVAASNPGARCRLPSARKLVQRWLPGAIRSRPWHPRSESPTANRYCLPPSCTNFRVAEEFARGRPEVRRSCESLSQKIRRTRKLALENFLGDQLSEDSDSAAHSLKFLPAIRTSRKLDS